MSAAAGAAAPPRDHEPPVGRGPLGESWRAWAALLIGVVAVAAHSSSSLTVSVLMKPMTAAFGWTRSDFALAATVRLAAITLMMPFAGGLADRLGARAVLAGGALAVGAAVLAMSGVASLPELVGVNLVMGPAQACLGSVAASALVLRLFRHRRGLAVGILNGGDNLINAAVPLAAASILAASGWRTVLVCLGTAYVVLGVGVLAALHRDDGRAAPRAARGGFAGLPWRDARLWVVCGAYAAIYAFLTSLQLHFHAAQTDAGRTGEVASSLLGLQVLVGALGAPLFGWLAERTSARDALCVAVAGLVVSAATLWLTDDLTVLWGWAVFHGLVNSGAVALLALVLDECFGPAQIGRLLGVAMVACMGATLVGNQWSAWVFDTAGSYAGAWRVYTALMVAALPPVLWLRVARAR